MENCDKVSAIDTLIADNKDRRRTELGVAVAIQKLGDQLNHLDEKFTKKLDEILEKQIFDRRMLNRHDRVLLAVKWLFIGAVGFAIANKVGLLELFTRLMT